MDNFVVSARKYRPLGFDEVVGQEHITTTLKNAIDSNKLAQALLFCGPRGIGKTTCARIVARMINGFEEKAEVNSLNIFELDAASNNSVDDIRNLIDQVRYPPQFGKYKVYIIDEVHMLTPEASNALLKTLEEPPEHVMFILATTNPEKLIETIRSRTTNIAFRKATEEEIVRSLSRVARGEKIKIKSDGLKEIAGASGGSFRDAVKVLEQLAIEKRKLDAKSISEFLFQTEDINIVGLIRLLTLKDTKASLLEVERILGRGVSAQNLIVSLLTSFRESLLGKMGIGGDSLYGLSKNDILTLIKLFSQAAGETKTALLEQLPIEIAIVEWCESDKGPAEIIRAVPDSRGEKKEPEAPPKAAEDPTPKAPSLKALAKEINEEVWKTILATVKPINTSIEALLRAARPMEYDGKVLTLGVYYRFHKERLEETSHRRILEDVASGVMGSPIKVVCTLTEPPAKVEPKVVVEEKTVLTEGGDEDIIKIAEEIFGN